VQQVDASRRSRHSNAYFTGIGRVKRIVLYDTLIEQLDEEELLAVLAHEVGHWKKGHILKRLLTTEVLSFALCYLAFMLLRWGGLAALLGLPAASFYAQATVLGFLLSLAGFFFTPLGSALSRRHEWQADAFATSLTENPQALATALAKLSRDNLANLHPHPLYAWFHYSHPPVAVRIARLTGRCGSAVQRHS
jgi:STE24 endopeptidase